MLDAMMRIAVFGTGGVGGYFGGRLAHAGEQVTFIARGAHLQAMQSSGLRIESVKGDFIIHPVDAVDDPRSVGKVDVVLLGVKAWQVPDAAEAMLPLLGPDTCIVPLQNGVDAPSQLAAVVGVEHVVGGLCRVSAFVAGPGHIRHVGVEPSIAFGELDGGRSERLERLRLAFDRSEVEVDIPEDIQGAMWEKLVFIAAISGVGAVTRQPLGVNRSLPETRRMLEQTMQEIIAVGRASQVPLPSDLVQTTMATIDGLPAGVIPSMQRDILDGRPSELEAQTGSVVRRGKKAGVPIPLNEYIYSSLLPQELQARGESHA